MNRLFSLFLNLLFPRRCLFCRKDLPHDAEAPLCAACAVRYPAFPPRTAGIPVGTCRYVLDYRAEARRAILAFKFHNMPQYAAAFGRMLSPAVADPDRIDCITWAPVSAARLTKRGYDQSRLLAEAVGRELDIPVRPMLRKTRHTRQQARLSRDRRRDNVRGAYTVIRGAVEPGCRVVLIDDIVTTGSTLSACCQALYEGGAGEVYCAALAH